MTIESQNTLYLSASQNLHEITTREAQQISHQFQEVSRISRIMQKNHEEYFSLDDGCTLLTTEPEFGVHKNGVYYKIKNNRGSSLYYSSKTKITPYAKNKALCSEAMDPLLKSIVETNPVITQAYFNSWDNLNRLYPFMKDAPAQYGPVLKMKDYNFYYLADAVHNPEKKPVWTSAYLDPAGQGWLISNIVPIYNKDFLEGVSGLDVTIDSLLRNILSLDVPWEGSAFLVDADGMILAMPEKVEKILSLKELKEHLYENNIQKTIQKPEEYNLFKIKNPELQKKMSTFFQNFNKLEEMIIKGKGYLLSQEIIPETGWRLIVLVDESLVYEPIVKLKEKTYWIGYVMIGLMAAFYILFFSYLLRKSSKIASKIASPIQELSLLTSDLGNKPDNLIIKQVGIEEVDRLTRNFNEVSIELDSRTKEYVKSQLREKMGEKDAEIAYKVGLFESASSYLHNIGNTLTMIDSKILSLRYVKEALDNSALGVTKIIGLIDKSDAKATQKEELNTFLHLFSKALSSDVTHEIDEIANSIEKINKQASVSIHHQQDVFNSNMDINRKYTQDFDVKNMLEELAEDYRVSFSKKNARIILNCTQNLMINNIKFQLHSGLSNIFKNALEAISMNYSIKEGKLSIRANRNGDVIFIEIEDNGVGVKPENVASLFQSGFTTKEDGHGLGLHTFNNFLNSNNGKLTFHSDGYLKGVIAYIEIGDSNVE